MKKWFVGILAMFSLSAAAGVIEFNPEGIEVEGDLGAFGIELDCLEVKPELDIITITLSAEKPAPPPEFIPKFEIHS